MTLEDTNDLGVFMDQLKDWAETHSFERIAHAIEAAERNSYTASELIIKYAETLKALRPHIPEHLPAKFRDQWENAIEIGFQAVQTVEYEEKERSIFSFG